MNLDKNRKSFVYTQFEAHQCHTITGPVS